MRWHPPVPGAGAVAPVRTGGASRLFRFDEASLPARYRRRAQSRYRRDRGRFPIIRVRPALPVRFVAGSAVGFPDVSIGRRIAGIAGSGRRAGNRFRLRGRAGVPWGAVRGPGRAVVRRGRVRPVGRRAGGFDKGGVSARWRAERWRARYRRDRARRTLVRGSGSRYRRGIEPSGGYCSASCS